MSGSGRFSEGQGVVVLAAYRPDPELFGVQLRSIRDQTRRDFRCLIGADGGQGEVRRLVEELVGDDRRFEVIGWDDNVGFYLNFERLLMAVPDDVSWVALSDQDDRWYPDKLARLVPFLDEAVLASGQARVITWPGETVAVGRTRRRVVPAEDLVFENQVTGSLSVFRRSLLATALPFPRLRTVTQLHDHWLALCAVAVDRYVVCDDLVQDYVQHGANLVGEVAAHRRWTPVGFLRRIVELGDEFEGGHSLAQCARACRVQSFGWRQTTLTALTQRVPELPSPLRRAHDEMTSSSQRPMWRALLRATRSKRTSKWVVATFLPGVPAEGLRRWDARSKHRWSLQPLD